MSKIFFEDQKYFAQDSDSEADFFPSRDARSITFLETHPTFDISTDF